MSAGPPDIPTRHLGRFRLAGALLALGLLVEAGTLFSSTAVSFLVFVLGGASLVVAGLLVYLYALFSR